MGDNSSGFPGFPSPARPLFRVASFSDSGDEQERHASSPQGRSNNLSRTPSKTAAASRLSQSVSGNLSMKKLQQALDEKTMEDEGNSDGGLGSVDVHALVLCCSFLVLDDFSLQRWS